MSSCLRVEDYLQYVDMPDREVKYPLLIYDGVCGFCNKMVQIVLRHDPSGAIFFIPRQSPLGQEIRKTMKIPENAESMVFLERDPRGEVRSYLHSDAVLRLAHHLGGVWKMMLAGYLVPRPIRDWLYRQFARNRYRFFGRSDQCIIPPRESRARFLDGEWENSSQELK